MEIGLLGEFGPNVHQHVDLMVRAHETVLVQTLHQCMEAMIVYLQSVETWKLKPAVLRLIAQVIHVSVIFWDLMNT